MEDTVSKSAYIEGRLKGLNELVGILKESMDSADSPSSASINKTIIRHVAIEVESIIADLEEHHGEHPALAEAQAAQKTLAKAVAASPKEITIPMMRKHVDAADELMNSLSEFKQSRGGKYPFDEAAEDAEK
ncbi:MAG: hypothetical protein WCX64_01650 [Candidatus Micrarchaeia archaeon]|jgi:type VI protein secretion system component VasK